MPRMSVKRMLSIAFAMVGIIPLLLFAFAFWSVLRRHLDEDVRATTQAVLQAVSIQTSEQVLEEPNRILPTLLMIAVDIRDAKSLRSLLRAAAIPRPAFRRFAFVDAAGRVEAMYPDDGHPAGLPYRFHAQKTEGNTSFSSPFVLADGSTVIEVNYSNENRTISGLLSLEGISSKLLLVALSPEDRVGVVDGEGRYMLSSDPSRVGRGEKAQERSRGTATALVVEDDGDYYASSIPIPGSSWRAVYLRSREIAEAPMRGFLLRICSLAAGGILLSATATLFAWRSVSKPLSILVSRIESVAAGRYAERVAGEFAVEFREIADSFNAMAESIERRDREIQRSEERYRLLFNGNRAPSLFVDEGDGSIRDANPAALAYYGYDELAGQKPTIGDIDVSQGRSILERLRDASRGEGGCVSTRQTLRSGEVRDVDLYVGSVEYEGRSYLHVIVFDVTERRIAEERTETALREKIHLLQEVYHRVKNNQQLVVSLLRLQADSDEELEAKRALKTAQDRMYAMALIHELVYQSNDLASIDMADFVARLISNRVLAGDLQNEAVTVQTESIHLDLERAIPFALAFNELLTAACRGVTSEGADAGSIVVRVQAGRAADGRKAARVVVEFAAEGRSIHSAPDIESLESMLVQALAGQLTGRLLKTGGIGEEPLRVELNFPIEGTV
jgi:PAS domain S-box-containing protein